MNFWAKNTKPTLSNFSLNRFILIFGNYTRQQVLKGGPSLLCTCFNTSHICINQALIQTRLASEYQTLLFKDVFMFKCPFKQFLDPTCDFQMISCQLKANLSLIQADLFSPETWSEKQRSKGDIHIWRKICIFLLIGTSAKTSSGCNCSESF